MKRIYKYRLGLEDYQQIRIPAGGIIRHVDIQREAPFIWVEVDPASQQEELVLLRMAGTGHDISDPKLTYVGTFITLDPGQLVFHLFELSRTKAEARR